MHRGENVPLQKLLWATVCLNDREVFRSRAVTTYFIINLAFSDLLTGIFAIPFKFQAALFQEWFLPNSLCQIVPYAETVSLSVSVFTLTASAVHEFRTVFFPKHGRLNTRSARSLVVLIWLIAALVSLPHGLFHKVYLIEDGDFVIAQVSSHRYLAKGSKAVVFSMQGKPRGHLNKKKNNEKNATRIVARCEELSLSLMK
ncbi:7 transmembrane receptor [Ancylostoma duodenale]|uniref:7 transmembrane receptor n=1 Tax=Ancylostoma duodenale TaxID=51022 RepID=A0A0C2DEZ2_9BILA|nr:7 transmembrane receptor [Ancylostoma duodenale]